MLAASKLVQCHKVKLQEKVY